MKHTLKNLLLSGIVSIQFFLQAQSNSKGIDVSYIEILILAIPLFSLILYLFVFIDILKSRFVSGTDKLIWLLVVFFIPILGIILYLIIGRKQKIKKEELN